MSSITDLYRKRRSASVASCAPPEAYCSTCGMLECLCRPRFFAGQVLSADDLNRLDAYIRGKHRLHNRQLHGFGVVNGLEVTCNPCGDGVTVSCGYALSPCGDDIVVCDAVTVDVCDLIARCGTERPEPCDPPRQPLARECSAAETEWVLAIRYAETPTRGVKPLYGSAPAQCSCGGGGGKSCSCGAGSGAGKSGCSCGGGYKSVCTCGAKPRGAPVQCEPTVVCVGFAFEVYRAPLASANDDRRGGSGKGNDSALLQRFKCCVEDLMKGAPVQPVEPITGDAQGWYLWALQFKAHLQLRLQLRPGTNCELLDRLAGLAITPPTNQNSAALAQAVLLLYVVFIDALLNCLCSALLPPCPLPSDDSRVALATLHVASNPCRVLRVCNWSVHRQIAVTMPALEYWFSVLPISDLLRELLQKMCCFDLASLLRLPDQPVGVAQPVGQPVGGPQPVAQPVGMAQPVEIAPGAVPGTPVNAVAEGVASGATAATPVNAVASNPAVERATLRLNPRLDDAAGLQGGARMLLQSFFLPGAIVTPELLAQGLLARKGQTAVDATRLPQQLLLQQFARPLGAAVGAELLSALGGAGRGAAVNGAAANRSSPPDEGMAELARTVRELGQRLQLQEQELASGAAANRSSPPDEGMAELAQTVKELGQRLQLQQQELERLRSAAASASSPSAAPSPKAPGKKPGHK